MKLNFLLSLIHWSRPLAWTVVMTVAINFSAFAQDVRVSGTVQDDAGAGLPGATVLVKGTNNGVVTDIDGNYSISAPSDGTLVFSFVGYEPVEEVINNRTSISVSLAASVQALEELVVVGYGEQKKVTVTGAVAQVQGKELVKSPAVEITNSLAGRLPGLVVIQESGEPGNDGASINIRGTNTFGNSAPLVIIDGVPDREGGLGRLSPQDIASISVLKDASAAIYGARAANGAILVTTKRGESGKANIRFDFNQGWSQPTSTPEMSTATQYGTIMNELEIFNAVTDPSEWNAAWDGFQSSGAYTTSDNREVNSRFPPSFFEAHAANNTDPWLYPDTDWFGDTFRNWSPQSRYNLQFDGGNEKLRYLVSMGYLDQDAIYENSATFYKQYSLRTNLDWQANDYISANVGVVARREDRNYPTESAGAIFRMLMRGRPNEAAVWPTGEPGPDIENGQNPVAITTNATGYDSQPTDYVQTNASVTLDQPWVEGLSLTLSGAIDYKHARRKEWSTPWELYFLDRVEYQNTGVPVLNGSIRSTFTDPRLFQSSETVLNTNMTAMLNYSRTFGAHTVGGLIGVTREDFQGEFFSAFRRNFLSTALDQLFVGGLEQQNINGSAYERARLGTYGRLTYNYQETYLLEFIWRYDGSYIFPEDDRFAFFPGFLAGWNLTNEDWFSVPTVDYLKLRVSYGETGNEDVRFCPTCPREEYAFLSTYNIGQFPINSAVANTLLEGVVPNPNFTWERARNFNVGFDATILGELDLTFEYFYNQRDQILLPNNGIVPQSSGIRQLPPENTGQLENTGIEFSVSYGGNLSDGGFWRVGTNGGYAKNEVTAFNETKESIPEYQWQEGKPYQAWLVYRSDGAFRDQADIDANSLDYSQVYPTIRPGDMKFQDVNGDGVINADDRVRLEKNRTPTFNFGITGDFQWKGFDVSMLWQGATGALIRVQTESGDIGNFLQDVHFENRWSIENPSSEHPRLASRGDTPYTGGNFGGNTYWLRSKDYIRLKNFEIGYTLPFEVSWMQSARIYINGLNLFTIQDSENPFDPEANADNGVFYPQQRIINTGFTLTF